MILFDRLRNGLDPIPKRYKYLASTFEVEAILTLRRVIFIIGLGQVTSLIVGMMIGYLTRTTWLLVIGLAWLGVGLLFIAISYKAPRRVSLFKLVFAGQVLILLLGGLSVWYTGELRPAFVLFLLVSLLSTLFSWLAVWNITLHIVLLVIALAVYLPFWQQSLLTPTDNFLFIILLTANAISVYLHALFSVQRWRSFLNRHKNYLLNAKLETSNMRLEALNNQLQNELALAHDIQISLLPSPFPEWPGFDIVCYNRPAQELGGDFYSYYHLPDERFALAIGDVSGKGVSAALLMTAILSLFDTTLRRNLKPALLLTQLDEAITAYTQSHQQNCSLCYLEIQGQCITVANAAGIPPYICSLDGQVRALSVGGLPLGQEVGGQLGYEEQTFTLHPGEFVVLTSDGVVEALNETHEMFGFDRLEKTLGTNKATTAQGVLEHLLAELSAYIGGAKLEDDLTIVVFQLVS